MPLELLSGSFASSQAMIEEAITRAEAFSVMYTPFATKIRADKIEKVKEVFVKTHPAYVDCIYTGELLVAHSADALPPWQPAQSSVWLVGCFDLQVWALI